MTGLQWLGLGFVGLLLLYGVLLAALVAAEEIDPEWDDEASMRRHRQARAAGRRIKERL